MNERAGYIYIIKAETGEYKVGRTKNIPQRMNLFAVKLPFDFEIIHTFPCDDMVEAERMLHDAYKQHGYHIRGEWFNISAQSLYGISQVGHFTNGKFYISKDSPHYNQSD